MLDPNHASLIATHPNEYKYVFLIEKLSKNAREVVKYLPWSNPCYLERSILSFLRMKLATYKNINIFGKGTTPPNAWAAVREHAYYFINSGIKNSFKNHHIIL